jgi:hypothetical protein
MQNLRVLLYAHLDDSSGPGLRAERRWAVAPAARRGPRHQLVFLLDPVLPLVEDAQHTLAFGQVVPFDDDDWVRMEAIAEGETNVVLAQRMQPDPLAWASPRPLGLSPPVSGSSAIQLDSPSWFMCGVACGGHWRDACGCRRWGSARWRCWG